MESPFHIFVRHRSFDTEPLPERGGIEVFDQPDATLINQARLDHLASLGLALENKTVLDVGCGVGLLAQFFVKRGCRVTCVDGRPENIESLRSRYPTLQAHVANVESDLARFGQHDVVFSYGLLYHLENPLLGLRNMEAAAKEMLLLETIVCDHELPVLLLDDETKSFSQALRGIACRPSPTFVVMALARLGFAFIYGPRVPPQYPDFQFEWKNSLEWSRDGHPIRCVFVATRNQISSDNLVLLHGQNPAPPAEAAHVPAEPVPEITRKERLVRFFRNRGTSGT
jgi:predicted RNA methylase